MNYCTWWGEGVYLVEWGGSVPGGGGGEGVYLVGWGGSVPGGVGRECTWWGGEGVYLVGWGGSGGVGWGEKTLPAHTLLADCRID